MKVRRFDPLLDYPTICQWMDKRERPICPVDQLPEHGWIVDGVAAVFLMCTDCSVAFVENFVTNEEVSKEDRLIASDLLFTELELQALALGFKMLVGYTSIMKVLALGGRYGMKAEKEPHWLFRKVLSEDACWTKRNESQALRA